MKYQVQFKVALEQTRFFTFDTLEEAIEKIAKQDLYFDEVALLEVNKELDVYDLMKARRDKLKGK